MALLTLHRTPSICTTPVSFIVSKKTAFIKCYRRKYVCLFFVCVCQLQFSTCSFTLLPLSSCVSSYSTPFSVHKFVCNKEECLLGSIPNASQTCSESEYKNPFHAVPKKAPELCEDSAKELKCLITLLLFMKGIGQCP